MPKEREINKPRLLTGYFVLPDKNAGQAIFHFKNAHYLNINRTFKAKTENKLSLSKIVVYLIRVPKMNVTELTQT
ncbi:MAG: hypothetical protein ACI85O_003678, partial [Saprospiraceae bacterium]